MDGKGEDGGGAVSVTMCSLLAPGSVHTASHAEGFYPWRACMWLGNIERGDGSRCLVRLEGVCGRCVGVKYRRVRMTRARVYETNGDRMLSGLNKPS